MQAPSIHKSKDKITKAIAAAQFLFQKELSLAELLFAKNELDAALQICVNISTFAYLNFTSYYSSYRLEKLISQIGEIVIKRPHSENPVIAGPKRRILHVASELYELGGHTPLMLKWIQRDIESEHSIFLTRQSKQQIPVNNFKYHGVDPALVCWGNSGESLVETAQALLDYSSHYDFLILHIHPNDVVPLLAFASEKPRPVYFLNHADHCFWLGVSIVDGIIQLREPPMKTDIENRSITHLHQFLLPIPVEESKSVLLSEKEIRLKYEIPESATKILLTTSTESKFNPILDYNYFEAIIPVMEKNPDTVLLIIGIGSDKPLAQQYKHPQIRYLGYLPPIEVHSIERIITLYIETIPYSSFTALLQVLIQNKPVQLMYAPPDVFRLFADPSFYAGSRNQWQLELNERIQNHEILKNYTEHLMDKVHQFYSKENWYKQLALFYAYADGQQSPQAKVFQNDKPKLNTTNEWFLYGMSLKEPYQFVLFREKSRRLQFNRIRIFIGLYAKLFAYRKQFFSFGLKHVISHLVQLFRIN